METRPTGRTPHEIAEIPPRACSNGHPFRHARSALVGFLPCACAGGNGHRTFQCARCGVVDYYPPHDRTVAPRHGSYDA